MLFKIFAKLNCVPSQESWIRLYLCRKKDPVSPLVLSRMFPCLRYSAVKQILKASEVPYRVSVVIQHLDPDFSEIQNGKEIISASQWDRLSVTTSLFRPTAQSSNVVWVAHCGASFDAVLILNDVLSGL